MADATKRVHDLSGSDDDDEFSGFQYAPLSFAQEGDDAAPAVDGDSDAYCEGAAAAAAARFMSMQMLAGGRSTVSEGGATGANAASEASETLPAATAAAENVARSVEGGRRTLPSGRVVGAGGDLATARLNSMQREFDRVCAGTLKRDSVAPGARDASAGSSGGGYFARLVAEEQERSPEGWATAVAVECELSPAAAAAAASEVAAAAVPRVKAPALTAAQRISIKARMQAVSFDESSIPSWWRKHLDEQVAQATRSPAGLAEGVAAPAMGAEEGVESAACDVPLALPEESSSRS